MESEPNRARTWWGLERRSEKLLKDAPRLLEIVCSFALIGLALEFMSEVVFYEWFYFRYHRDYAYTLRSRTEEWVYELAVLMLALWMIGMASHLIRGTSRRRDRGLFAPRSLRAWGVVFGVLPILILVLAPSSILHFHMLVWFWIAATACFVLAARRSRAIPIEAGPPPPIE